MINQAPDLQDAKDLTLRVGSLQQLRPEVDQCPRRRGKAHIKKCPPHPMSVTGRAPPYAPKSSNKSP